MISVSNEFVDASLFEEEEEEDAGMDDELLDELDDELDDDLLDEIVEAPLEPLIPVNLDAGEENSLEGGLYGETADDEEEEEDMDYDSFDDKDDL